MKEEITAASLFLSRLISKGSKLAENQVEEFRAKLEEVLEKRFENHWFPDKPFRGQGYRCIRINPGSRRESTIEQAATECGLKYSELGLPIEVTLWIDPREVTCRFGEHKGSLHTVASFEDGNKENALTPIDDALNISLMSTDKREHESIVSSQLSPVEKKESLSTKYVARRSFADADHSYNRNTYRSPPPPPPPKTYYSPPQPTPWFMVNSPPPVSSGSNFNRVSNGSPTSFYYPTSYQKCTPSTSPQSKFSQGRYQRQNLSPNYRTDRYHWVNKILIRA